MKYARIDSHCHIDLYDDPLAVARAAENEGIATVAVTYLPSHFVLACEHLRQFEYVRPALGLHPLVAKQHASELGEFVRLAAKADYIGEIGLDFSRDGMETKKLQEESFAKVLSAIGERRRFVTLHSRGAATAVLEHLAVARMYPVVFHWFSGTRSELVKVIDAGHYVSVNTKMIQTARWSDYIKVVPRNRILTETDGPFVMESRKPAIPGDVKIVLQWLSEQWSVGPEEASCQVCANFSTLEPAKFF